MNRRLFIKMLMLKNFYLLGSIGCMDRSKHTHMRDGYDYKVYHYVKCNCPCERYQQLPEKGECMKCGHYGAPSTMRWDIW